VRLIVLLATILALAFAASPSLAGSVLDRIKLRGSVRCGAELAPGLADMDEQAPVSGLLVDVCRAIAIAVLGPSGRVEFRGYGSSKDYDAIRHGEDDVFFLGASQILDEDLAGTVLPGPVVFYQWHALMQPTHYSDRTEDLTGASICYLNGSGAARSLEAFAAARHLEFIRMAFTEDGEMDDAYNVQHCRALVGEATTLAEVRLRRDPTERAYKNPADFDSRLLPQPLAVFPIFATTGTLDAAWSAVVAWTVYTLQRAETPQAAWASPGISGLPIEAPQLGLDKGWQKQVVDSVGTYADMYRRRLGEDSPFKLPRGPNAPWTAGGLIAAPYAE
jgi:general L-amino acid transport system substrate-binding protein